MAPRVTTNDAGTDGPPRELREAVDQFNRGQYFECHETLEQLWTQEIGPIRSFHQGIIQVATGFHHLRRGNLRGARICLDGGLERLRAAPPELQQVDVARLVTDAEQMRALVVEPGAAGSRWWEQIAPPLIHWVPESTRSVAP